MKLKPMTKQEKKELGNIMSITCSIFMCVTMFLLFINMIVKGVDSILEPLFVGILLFLTILLTTVWFGEFIDLRNKTNEDEKPDD